MDLDGSGMDFSLPDIESQDDQIILEKAIQERLQGYYGPGYTDVSLSKYIVVMLRNKTARPVVEESLVEYLGIEDATDCSAWLFSNLRSLLPRRSNGALNNDLTQRQTQGAEPTRNHIRSAVNYPNTVGGGVSARPSKDWYDDDGGGRDHQEGQILKQEEYQQGGGGMEEGVGPSGGTYRSIEPVFTEEQLRSLTLRVPMREKAIIRRNKRKNRNLNKDPPGIQNTGMERDATARHNGHRHDNFSQQQRRFSHRQSYQQEQERLVITVNGRPVASIGGDHPQIEQVVNKANVLNPNNSEFYAAIPKAECSVLVKGLARTATNGVIRAHFSAICGPIPRVSILKRPISGENSNLAWVSLTSEHAAEKALQLNGSTILFQKINVWPKESEEARKEVAQMNQESMDMYMPGNYMDGWGQEWRQEEWDERRFKYVRGQDDGAGVDVGGGGAEAMEVQGGVIVKEEH